MTWEDSLPKGFTDCRCPKCQRDHKMRIAWTGTIPARKFCRLCKEKADTLVRSGIQPISIIISNRDYVYQVTKSERSDGD